MNMILMPYTDIHRSIESLSDEHLSLMKINSTLLIMRIYENLGWINKVSDISECDFYKFYFNNGKPYIDFLIDYYYTVYVVWKEHGGSDIDTCGEYERIYRVKHAKCTKGNPWKEEYCLYHRMWLIKYDRGFYKRSFRNNDEYVKSSKKVDFHFFKDGKPKVITEDDLMVTHNHIKTGNFIA